MIVVDTSILVAIVLEEPDALRFADAMADATAWAIPASCYLEAVMVLGRSANGRKALDDLIERGSAVVLPIDEPVSRLAADAFERYSRRRGHPAQLNFGDCLSYATARCFDAPLLYKGGDFALTDVVSAV